MFFANWSFRSENSIISLKNIAIGQHVCKIIHKRYSNYPSFPYTVSGKAKSILSKPLPPPAGIECERFEGYWLTRGDRAPVKDERYVLTNAVKANMKDVARVVSCG